MKGIVGRKIGMSQIFDPESGVATPVTVIEAGPCPIVTVKTQDADGYDAVQLAFEPVAERKVSKGERGHLAKNGVGPHHHVVEFRGTTEFAQGESITVETFEPGERVRSPGSASARASRERSSATASVEVRRRTVRTTFASPAPSARRRRPRASARAFAVRAGWEASGRRRSASLSTRFVLRRTCCS